MTAAPQQTVRTASPERPADEPPSWPLWYGPAAFLAVSLLVGTVVALASVLSGSADGRTPPGLVLGGTVLQDAALVAVAVGLASRQARPRPWHFGLRRIPLRPAVAATALALISFYLLAAAYTAILDPTGEQTVLEDLGADRDTVLLVASALLVVGFAPFAEEFFFRGFFYGALRTRLGVAAAAGVNGLVFGAIHYSGPDTLSVIPPLVVLGVLFCLLYERTGSLYPAIAFHALNNGLAFAVEVGGAGAGVAAAVATAAIALCVIAGARQRPGAPLPFGERQWAHPG